MKASSKWARLVANAALIFLLYGAGAWPSFAQTASTNQTPPWAGQPLSLADAVNLALQQNGDILRGKSDLEAQYGVVVQTRAIAVPKLQAAGDYHYTTEVEKIPFPGFPTINNYWSANIQIVQTIYQGGQINSSLRSAKLTEEAALLEYQTVIADSLLAVRVGYYGVLQTAEQVVVEQASVKLLEEQLDDQQRRFNAGTVPRFNVLQAEVALANERPRLIRARGDDRIAKNNLVNLLGYHVPPQISEDIPLQLTDKLDAEPYDIELPVAIGKALENRSEIAALRKQESLRKEGVIGAGSGYKPAVQLVAGYGGRSAEFITDDPAYVIHGVTAGAQVSWNLFDGFLTKGKVQQARAQYEGSKIDVDNVMRNIELEVRTDYSNFIEARETLESQQKVQEEAEEALRLATARNNAGTATQLDVLSAQTELTQARSTQVEALHDYDVARARLERAMGINIMQTTQK
jgi:outer membrane protein